MHLNQLESTATVSFQFLASPDLERLKTVLPFRFISIWFIIIIQTCNYGSMLGMGGVFPLLPRVL
jgi:hypothetical protein